MATFGDALEAVKVGRWACRSGWNGKGMHIYLEDAFTYLVSYGRHAGSERRYEPCIVLFTARGEHQPGWLASQADMLANDWQILEPS